MFHPSCGSSLGARLRSLVGLSALLASPACSSCRDADDRDVTAAASTPIATTIEPTDAGTALVRYDNADVMEIAYVFFGDEWRWAYGEVEIKSRRAGEQRFTVTVEDLGLHIDGSAKPGAEGELVVRLDIEAERSIVGPEGGGLEFRLLGTDVLQSGGAKKPDLLPDDRGFGWEIAPGRVIEARFTAPVERVFFERGRTDVIRAFVFDGHIEAGRSTVELHLQLPEGGRVLPPLGERLGAPDGNWSKGTLAWDRWPVDLSFLNADDRPAGAHGRVRAGGSRLEFEDGTPARFWGANVAAQALFTGSREDVARQAERLAAFGFNLVRIHHHDSAWVRPNVFGADATDTKSLSTEGLERIDWWVKCLQERGIYVWIDLHVGRAFTPSDGIAGHRELASTRGEGKAFNYVNEDIEGLMAAFAASYFDRHNQFTGLRYPDDPGIVAVLVTNENDITHHGGRELVPESGHPHHVELLRRLGWAFSERHAIDPAGVAELAKPGPSKLFLNDLEAAFARRSTDRLRAMGYRGLVATTNYWGRSPLYSLPALTVGDLVDVHSYGDERFLAANPRYTANFVSWIGAGRVADLPLTVSEWNVPYPARDRFAAPMYVAAISAFQGWDAPMFYVYTQADIRPPRQAGQWTSWDDPAIMAMMPAAALLHRRGDVALGKRNIVLSLDEQQLYHSAASPLKSMAIRTAIEKSRFSVALPNVELLDWDRATAIPDGATVITTLDAAFVEPGATEVRSDTGELRRDWATGLHTIDTARTQAAAGSIGGHTLELADATFAVTTPAAAVALSSLDGAPLRTSKQILLSVVAQAIADDDKPPYRAQPVAGEVLLRSDHPALEAVPLYAREAGGPSEPLPLESTPRGHRLRLPAQLPTHWFEIRPR